MKSETRERLRSVSTATITMQLLKRGIRGCYLQGVLPLDASLGRMVGPAYTVRYVPLREDKKPLENIGSGENIARRAIEECPEGAVLVSDARREPHCGTLGDILALRLKRRGVAGFVSDGGVRDVESILQVGLPVFCAGPAAPASPAAHVPVDLEVAIACGGAAVYPADVIVGDRDGVVVIPAHLADEVASDGAEQEGIEAFIQKLIGEGRSVIGTYPPTDAIRAEYQAWLAAGKP